jgi:anhydro-N-acetylmuramic acid kinase
LAKIKNKAITVLGLMSGTSLDGLDMAICEFTSTGKGYTYKILAAQTIQYSLIWKKGLSSLKNASAENYFEFNAHYGSFMAAQIKRFTKKVGIQPFAIASHGHTVFHQPKKGFSTQVGSGATMAAKTGITTVCDFRSLDVANGGQGAPLVPIGDELLFGNYDACLNIGGIANISYKKSGKRVAYDVCEANMLLNYLAEKLNRPFDSGGKIAASGIINRELLKKLNALKFYKQQGAKSIGREWFEKNCVGLIDKSKLSIQDLLATATHHVAEIIANDLNKNSIKTVLVTGGGAFNQHLISLLESKTACKIILPSKEVINFKEALIFAFLGYLRVTNQPNTLASVTGSKSDSIGGAVYQGVY